MNRRLVLSILLLILLSLIFYKYKNEEEITETQAEVPQKISESEDLEPIAVKVKKVESAVAIEKAKEITPISLADFELLLKQDDICEVSKHINDISIYDKAKILFANPEVNPISKEISEALEEMFAPNSIIDGNVAESPRSDVTRFYNALILGRLLDSGRTAKTDFNEARKILLDLKKNDPANRAYSYFLSQVMLELNEPKEKIRDEILSQTEVYKFDVFENDIRKAIIEKGFVNSSYFYLALIIKDLIFSPDFFGPQTLIKNFIKPNDFEIINSVLSLSFGMTRDGIRSEGTLERYNWSIDQYKAGLALYKEADKNYPKNYWLEVGDLYKKGYKLSGMDLLDKKFESSLANGEDRGESEIPAEADRQSEVASCVPQANKSYFEGFLKIYSRHLVK